MKGKRAAETVTEGTRQAPYSRECRKKAGHLLPPGKLIGELLSHDFVGAGTLTMTSDEIIANKPKYKFCKET